MRKLIGAFCATSLTAMALIPTTASASCVAQVYANEDFVAPTYSYFYGEPYGAGNTYTYYGYTTSSQIAGGLASATASHNRVYVVGDAASCPTSGTYRYIGTILYFYINM